MHEDPAIGIGAAKWPRRERLLLTLIILLAAVLRFYDLTYQSIWGDEAFSVYAAKGVDMHFMTASLVDATHRKFVNPRPSPRAVLRACIRNEGTPPAYYVTLSAWLLAFGSGEFAVRSLSAVLGVLNVAAVYLLARRLFRDPAPALLAALFMAVSPLGIYFSQEARAYILANLLVIVSSWLLLRAVESGRRAGPWLAYAASAAALCYTFYFAGLVIASHFVYLLIHERRSLRPWIYAAVFAGVLYAPWLLIGFRTQMAVSSGYAPPGPSSTGALLAGHLRLVRYIFDSLLLGPMYSRAMIGNGTKVAVEIFVLGLAATACVRLTRRGLGGAVTFPLLLALLPLAVISAFGIHKGTFWYMKPRYHMWEAVGIMLLAAGAVATFRPAARATLAGAVCLFSLAAAPFHFYPGVFNWSHSKPDFRAAARIIASGQRRGDIVLVNIAGHMIPLNYYYTGGLRQVGIAETGRYDLIATLDRYTRKRQRVWLLVGLDTRGHGDEEITAFLDGRFPKKTTFDLRKLRLTLYRRGPGGGERRTPAQ